MFAEDRTQYFRTEDFGEAATWTPAGGGGPYVINVIFESEFREYDIGAGQDGLSPFMIASDEAIAQGAGMKRGDAVNIKGVDYKVARLMPDGTGMTMVMLRAT